MNVFRKKWQIQKVYIHAVITQYVKTMIKTFGLSKTSRDCCNLSIFMYMDSTQYVDILIDHPSIWTSISIISLNTTRMRTPKRTQHTTSVGILYNMDIFHLCHHSFRTIQVLVFYKTEVFYWHGYFPLL